MHIRYGYSIELVCAQDTPVIVMLDVHPDRRGSISAPDRIAARALATGAELPEPAPYLDEFGNICRRFIAPAGGAGIKAEGVIYDSGFHEEMPIGRQAIPPEALPPETLPFLLGSRYCEVEKLTNFAWSRFGGIQNGAERVQAICDFAHDYVRFDYGQARNTRTAAEVLEERVGVCRDFTHLAVTLCRAVNIPARYCTGYLGDIGVPIDPNPMDFSAWFEVYLDGAWWTFDARHNEPRIGRVVIARGRDATDVPIIHTFGPHFLQRFEVITEEVQGRRFPTDAATRRDRSFNMAAALP